MLMLSSSSVTVTDWGLAFYLAVEVMVLLLMVPMEDVLAGAVPGWGMSWLTMVASNFVLSKKGAM